METSNTSKKNWFQQIRTLEKTWNKVMVALLKDKYSQYQRKLPSLTRDELARQSPYLLENLTKERLTQKKGEIDFIILTSPSGGGKTTVGKEFEKFGIVRLPRLTTRIKRPGEQEGVDYYFVTDKEFLELIEKKKLLFYVADPLVKEKKIYRGISRDIFLKNIKDHKIFYLDSNVVTSVRLALLPELKKFKFLFIVILPPSFRTLFSRIIKRTSDEKKELQKKLKAKLATLDSKDILNRLHQAIQHPQKTARFADIYLVNDKLKNVSQKIRELVKIIK